MSTSLRPVEFIAIGREILDGRVVDTNSVWLAQQIKKLGLVLRYAQKVDDDIERIVEAFSIASRRSEIIFVSGGLGPTSDDLTAEAFAKFQHSEPVLNPEAEKLVRDYLERRQRPINEAQLKQAYLPVGAEVIVNNFGTAPAFAFKERTRQWFFLPGVPRELQGIYDEKIKNTLPRDSQYRHYTWITQFTAESALQMELKDIQIRLPKNFEFAFRTKFPENYVSIYASLENEEQEKIFEDVKVEITKRLETSTYSHGENPTEISQLLFQKLKDEKILLAFVESCTGGFNSHRLTDISGASDVLMASWITYDNAMKIDLGVQAKTIEEQGAVSEHCAGEMVQSALGKLIKNYPNKGLLVISTTGIAGPTGATPQKPVGLCYIALAYKGADPASKTQLEVHKIQTPVLFEREQNKLYFSQKSFSLALNLIDARRK